MDIYDAGGGLDKVIDSYKKERAAESGFLTQSGTINSRVFARVMKRVADDECHAYRRIHARRFAQGFWM